jgi:uncharacterized protein DUF6789
MVAGHPTSDSQRHGYNAQGRREDWVSDSLLSGFVATFAMGGALAVAYGLAHWIGNANGGRVEQWFYGLQHNVITDRTGNSVIVALGLNLAMGLIFALIYGAVEQRLPGREGIQRGMIFALIPWLLSIIAFFPIMDGGIFGKDLHAGPLPIVGNLVLHLIYGAVLGLTYHVDLDAWLDGTQEDHDSALNLQKYAVYGLMAGAVVGAFAGLLVRNQFSDTMNTGMSIVVGVLVCGAIGALIGSFMTEDRKKPLQP